MCSVQLLEFVVNCVFLDQMRSFTFSAATQRQCSLPTFSLALGIVCMTLFYRVETCKDIVTLVYISLVAHEIQHLWIVYMNLYNICREMSTNDLYQFSIWISFLLLSFESFIYILGTSSLLDL